MAGTNAEIAAMLFSTDEVMKLTGLSRGQVRDWAIGARAFYRPAHPSMGRSGVPLFSFRDVVSLRTLAMLAQHASTRSLRRLGLYLRDHYQDPWASLRFWLADGEVQFDDPKSGKRISGRKPGQIVAKPVYLEVRRLEAEMRTRAQQLRTRTAEQIGHVKKRRGVAEGRVVVDGTRVPTEAIWNFHQAGYSSARIREQYPHLTDDDVKAALDHERSRRKVA